MYAYAKRKGKVFELDGSEVHGGRRMLAKYAIVRDRVIVIMILVRGSTE